MKIRLAVIRQKLAGALIVTLVICSVLAFSVLGYLSVIEQQDRLGRRSQSWNYAMTVAEAGIEEGLQHLNLNYANLPVQGWGVSGGNFVKTNTLSDGNAYVVTITYGQQPIIFSQSLVRGGTLAQNTTAPFFAAIGIDPASGLVSRAVRVRCYRGGLYTKAMAAKDTIDLRGNNVLTDSFDSENPMLSNNGLYDPTRTGDNGDVASNSSIVSSISIGNASIYGHVATGPGGTVAIGPLGGVGTHSWQLGNDGIQSGYVTDDSNFTFPDTSLPYTASGATATATSGDVAEQVTVISSNSVSSTTYPGDIWGGVSTNTLAPTTVSTLPSPIPAGMVTNSTLTTTSYYPSSDHGVVTTNILGYTTTSFYPSPAPSPITTNLNYASSGSLPSPLPTTITTNTSYVKDKNNYPDPGTYVGEVITNGVNYSYYKITGYTWEWYSYTYPNKFSYTYALYTYTYPNYSYNYSTYATNVVWQTNYYDNILNVPGGNYYMSELAGKTIVTANVNLVVGGNVAMSGSDIIKIKPGGSMTNWVGGTSVALSGNGVVNESGFAKNYVLLAAPSVTTVRLDGNGTFTGVLVAPNGNITLNGSGKTVYDFIGSLMVQSVVMNGSFRFHYDEALGRMPASGRFLIGAWDEVPISAPSSTTPVSTL